MKKQQLLLLEEIFTVVTLLLYGGGFVSLLSGGIDSSCTQTPTDEGSSQILIALFSLTYLISATLLLLRWKIVAIRLEQNKSILLLIGLAFVSCLWSDALSVSLNRSIALLGTTFFGVYFGSRYPLEKQIQLLGWSFGIGIFFSIFFAVAIPRIGTMCSHEGAWRGIYSHKNSLGRIMALSTITFLLLVLSPTKSRLLPQLGLIASIALLIISTSKTSLVIALTLLLIIPIYRIFRLREKVLLPILLSVVILNLGSLILLLINVELILASLGRDLTLSGRTELWIESLKMVKQRFLFGHGYHGFWLGWDSHAADVWRVVGWEPPHAHNGLIDLALELGLLGIAIFLIGYAINLNRAFIWVRLTKISAGFFPLLYLSFLFLANITESSLLKRNTIFWVLYVSISLTMAGAPGKELKSKLNSE